MGLNWVRGAVATPHGPIRIHATEQSIVLEVPVGVEAQLLLPTGKWVRNGEPVKGESAEAENGTLVMLHHAGTFRFTRVPMQANDH